MTLTSTSQVSPEQPTAYGHGGSSEIRTSAEKTKSGHHYHNTSPASLPGRQLPECPGLTWALAPVAAWGVSLLRG